MGKIQLAIHTIATVLQIYGGGLLIINPTNTVAAVELSSIVTPEFFDKILNQAGPGCKGKQFYKRRDFLKAAKSYPRFGNFQSDHRESRREVAAFFAHVTHETGQLCYVEETERGKYCDSSAVEYPCVHGKQYYGRGPLQLSWNYNYGACGKANGFDGLRNPEIVATDPVLTWKTALWFWTTSVGPTERKGFGETIHRVNGLECHGGNAGEVDDRVRYYIEFCKQLDVTPGQHIRC